MTTFAPIQDLPTPRRRRLIALGLLRASAVATLVVAAYYLLPLYRLTDIALGVSLTVAMLALATVAVFQVRAIIRAAHPAIRAIEALAATAPAARSAGEPAEPLTRRKLSDQLDLPVLDHGDRSVGCNSARIRRKRTGCRHRPWSLAVSTSSSTTSRGWTRV